MSIRKIFVAATACCALFAGGCVSSGTYTTKEQEAQQLSKDLQASRSSYTELQEKQNNVLSENSDLKKQVVSLEEQLKKIGVELEALQVRYEKLVTENRPENLLKKIGERFTELQQAIEKLQAENETLKKKIDLGRELTTKEAPKINLEKEDTVPSKPKPVTTEPVVTEPGKTAPLEPIPSRAEPASAK